MCMMECGYFLTLHLCMFSTMWDSLYGILGESLAPRFRASSARKFRKYHTLHLLAQEMRRDGQNGSMCSDVEVILCRNNNEELMHIYFRGARREVSVMRHACLAFMLVGDDGQGHVE
jgi:hypothetical protein